MRSIRNPFPRMPSLYTKDIMVTSVLNSPMFVFQE